MSFVSGLKKYSPSVMKSLAGLDPYSLMEDRAKTFHFVTKEFTSYKL